MQMEQLLDKIYRFTEHLDSDELRKQILPLKNEKRAIEFWDTVEQHFINRIKQIQDQQEEYENLEKSLQKHESEIRKHIRMEQQLKLYAESLQQKYEESEQTRSDLLEQTKQLINGVKRDNQRLAEQNSKMQEENQRLNDQLKQAQESQRVAADRAENLEEQLKTIERKSQASVSRSGIPKGQWLDGTIQKEGSLKKVNLEVDYKKGTIKSETPPLSSNPVKLNASPLVKQRKTHTPAPNLSAASNNSDYLNVKIEITENTQQLHQLVQAQQAQAQMQMQLNQQQASKELNERKVHQHSHRIYHENGARAQEVPVALKMKELSTLYNSRSKSRGPSERVKQMSTSFYNGQSKPTTVVNHQLLQITNNKQFETQHKRSKSFGLNKLRSSLNKSNNLSMIGVGNSNVNNSNSINHVGGAQNGQHNNVHNDVSRISNLSNEYNDFLNQDLSGAGIGTKKDDLQNFFE